MGNRKRSRKIGFILMGIVFGLLFYVWQHIQMVCLGYKLNDLNRQVVSLGEKNNILKRKISRNTNYEKIERIATTKLNMIYPEHESIIYLIE